MSNVAVQDGRRRQPRCDTSALRTPHSARHARGFTMIEIMTAVAIIVLLLGIFVFGFRNVGTGAQVNQTRNVLEQLRNALGEATKDKAASKKFFEQQLPMVYSSFNGAGSSTPFDTLPTLVVPKDDATLAKALDATKRVTYFLQTNANAKTFIDGLQATQKRQETVRVSTAAETPRPVPVILDYWGNPILFVFDGLQQPAANGTATPIVTTAGQPTGGLSGLVINKKNPADAGEPLPTGVLRSPDRRPFWFSAGPDGKYETHDDNLYSFEN